MTVKEAFSKAFGEVPEGASCHIGAGRNSQNVRILRGFDGRIEK